MNKAIDLGNVVMAGETFVCLKPQDLVLALKIVSYGAKPWTKSLLARELQMPLSSFTQSLARLESCNLYNPRRQMIMTLGLEALLFNAVQFVFPAHRGRVVRGVPTSIAAAPLSSTMDVESLRWPPVWANPLGTVQGYEIAPLYELIDVVITEPLFYELMALVDVLREGRPRERELAKNELAARFKAYLAAFKTPAKSS